MTESKSFKFTNKQVEALKILNGPQRDFLLYGGARSGKTFLAIVYIIQRAILAPGSNHLICRYRKIHLVISIIKDTFPTVMAKVFPRFHKTIKWSETAYSITFTNGSRIFFRGIQDFSSFESILGTGFSTVYFNETSQIPYVAYNKCTTRLSEMKGVQPKFLLDLNPQKKRAWVYRLFFEKVFFEGNKYHDVSDPDQYAAPIQMNPIDNLENLPAGFVKSLENLPEADRKRFLYGEFAEDETGGVYEESMAKARKENRIRDNLLTDTRYPIQAVFDIGSRDATACWVVQFLPDRILFLDYLEGKQTATTDFILDLWARKWYIKTLLLPFDSVRLQSGDLGSTAQVLQDLSTNAEIEKCQYDVQILKRMSVNDTINLCRTFFEFCYFDKDRCLLGIEALDNYHYKYDEMSGVYAQKPTHDWSSHGADAFRYAVIGYQTFEPTRFKVEKDTSKRYFEDWFVKHDSPPMLDSGDEGGMAEIRY